jgi:hypothetical protein
MPRVSHNSVSAIVYVLTFPIFGFKVTYYELPGVSLIGAMYHNSAGMVSFVGTLSSQMSVTVDYYDFISV